MTGWECPRCHRCYAPHVTQCTSCVPNGLRERVRPDIFGPTPFDPTYIPVIPDLPWSPNDDPYPFHDPKWGTVCLSTPSPTPLKAVS